MFKNIIIKDLIKKYSYAEDFFETMGIPLYDTEKTLTNFFDSLDSIQLDELGIDGEDLYNQFVSFMKHMANIKNCNEFDINEITIIGGHNKSGESENCSITLKKGETMSIVGPTGSGKSRLLADIEWIAQADTPTKRKILVNGKTPPVEWRFSPDHKLVAQLSQNMNFVMDLTVYQFIKLHAESRMVDNVFEKTMLVIEQANLLAGEKFNKETPITSLSGGQSRALMIADTAFLSRSPIVLIDEIENAGIDRKKALDLLVKKDKIILMVTHDPILALMGERRIVIKNGGIHKIIPTTESEKMILSTLEEMDKSITQYRNLLRKGELMV